MSEGSDGAPTGGPGEPRAGGAAAASEPDLPDALDRARSEPASCDFDLVDPARLQAVWLTFQRERSATCPVTDAPFDLALAHHPAEDDAALPEVRLACGRCRRQVAFSPPDAFEVFGWAE